jgi:hypothetical protein
MKTIFKQALLFTLTLTLSVGSFAQSEVFKVLASRGKNTLSDGSSVFAGKKLLASDIIKVSENSYLGLIHSSGHTLELKTPGSYKISDLSSQVLAKSSSITKKYSDYVVGELTKSDGGDVHANYQKNMKVTGSVERGGTFALTACLPKSSSIIENLNTVVWNKNPKATSYTVELLNMFDDAILTKETTDTSLTFDLNAIKLPKDNTIIVKVKANGGLESPTYILKNLVEAKNPDVFSDKNALNKEYTEESALSYLMKASFYAQNNLFVDAKKSFESAIRLEPEVQEYKEAYKNFLAKNNLDDFYPYSK